MQKGNIHSCFINICLLLCTQVTEADFPAFTHKTVLQGPPEYNMYSTICVIPKTHLYWLTVPAKR